MLCKALAIFALVAAVNGGYLADVGAQSEQTVRGYGGQSTITQFSKAVDGPFSSVRKSDTRVTNNAIGAYGYAAPAYATQAYAAAPAYATHAYAAAPALAVGGYAAPALAVRGYGAPALGLGNAYGAATLGLGNAYGASTLGLGNGYGAAVLGNTYAGAIGHSYSAVSPAVATLNFNGYGLGSYGY